MWNYRLKRLYTGVIWLILVASLSLGMVISQAQDADNTISFTGEVTEVSESIAIIGGITVDFSGAVIPADGLLIGSIVQVNGVAEAQTIVATIIVLIEAPPPSPTATQIPMEATPIPVDPTATTIPAEPTAVATDASAPTPTSQPAVIVDGAPIIIIEGPVTSININTITIFDIDIQVDPADAILTEIRIGDIIRVAGQSSIENNVVIIVAINIVIVETTIIVINAPGPIFIPVGFPPNCRRTPKGKITCKRT